MKVTPLRRIPKTPRFPVGPWPAELRADMVAALLDFDSTTELCAAIERGEAPRPTSWRGSGSNREPTWSREVCESHVAERHGRLNGETTVEGLI